MIHFLPESPASEVPAPYAEAVARLASIRQALACVEQVAGKPVSQRDSEARLALAFPGANPPVQRCFDQRSARVASAAAASSCSSRSIAAGLDTIDQLFSL